MIVQRVLEFIDSFKLEQLTSADQAHLRLIAAHFLTRKPEGELTTEDIRLLIDGYKARWLEIQDKEQDYFLNPAINTSWINFAKELEAQAGLNYLKILMPTLPNILDPNDASQLSETVNLDNFYIGYDGSLHRKRSLFDLLQQHHYSLFTYRRDTAKTRQVFTLEELSRLKNCKQTQGYFSLTTIKDGEASIVEFESFWDFMRKLVFPRLTRYGEMPKGLLPHLLELVELYYSLKIKGVDFAEFKTKFKFFSKGLYSDRLENINFLYGQKVDGREDYYLLDVLTTIFDAQSFSLDAEMRAISKFLYQFNPALKILHRDLDSMYAQLTERDEHDSSSQLSLKQAYERCCSILVSLFISKFKLFIFTGQRIEAWDITNNIPRELFVLYTKILPLISTRQRVDYVAGYNEIINAIVAPKLRDRNFWTRLCREPLTKQLLIAAENSSFTEIGAYWFEPELIVSALMNFHTTKRELKAKIAIFLDDLINTYVSIEQNQFIKQLRVNILFSKLLAHFNEHQRRNLMIVIRLCNPEEELARFISNCVIHINHQLKLLGYLFPESTQTFFRYIKKLYLPHNLQHTRDVVSYYVKNLPKEHLKGDVVKQVNEYFVKLEAPILTATERESSITPYPRDYLGAYT